MTTRYVNRCSVDGCPTRDPDFQGDPEEWHTCWAKAIKGHKCWGPLDHQHVPKKGMGGHNPNSKIRACLCRAAHDKIDNSPYWGNAVVDAPEGKVYTIWQVKDRKNLLWRIIEAAPDQVPEQKVVVGRDRPVSMGETLPAVKEETKLWVEKAVWKAEPNLTDLTQYSDEQLATLFAWADKQQKDSFLTKCQVVHAYRERHVQHWGGTWLEHAYDLFEGAPSRRTLEAYANIWGICDASDVNLEHIGPLTDSRSLMQFIGRKNPEDGRVALEAAVAYVAEFGEAPTEKALRHKLGEESKPDLCPKTDLPHNWQRVCRDCGRGKT